MIPDREDAMKDDYGLDANYSYDEEEEWGDDEAAWTAEEEQEEEPTDAKDESTAYLEFLNEEASIPRGSKALVLANMHDRRRSSVTSRNKIQTMSSGSIACCSSHLWISLSHTRFSARA